MGKLTTHILDTANGQPADGVCIRLYSIDGERRLVADVKSNADGRSDEPLLEGDTFTSGGFELEFDVGSYFDRQRTRRGDLPFLDVVVIRFHANGDEHYHVPLLVSPFGYSTYRGS